MNVANKKSWGPDDVIHAAAASCLWRWSVRYLSVGEVKQQSKKWRVNNYVLRIIKTIYVIVCEEIPRAKVW